MSEVPLCPVEVQCHWGGRRARAHDFIAYTLHPSPYILHPTPCTLHPTPYTLRPTPYTLHPSWWAHILKWAWAHNQHIDLRTVGQPESDNLSVKGTVARSQERDAGHHDFTPIQNISTKSTHPES